jgi:UDP-N-acetylglucosamine acyltransferase
MEKPETLVHPSAVVHPRARLDHGVHIGPGCVIEEFVSLGKNTRLDAHVFITGHTAVGEGCRFFPYSAVGTEPQDVGYQQEETRVEIGDRNLFREFMTINRGTPKDAQVTRIGNDNYFMAYSHIAHDCQVGSRIVFMNGVTLAGHCRIDDHAQISAFTGVHQFCRIGTYSYVGGFSVITQDILPFSKVAGGRPSLIYGTNAIGLRRLGFTRERIKTIKDMFRLIFFSDLNTAQAVERIEKEFSPGEDRDEILSFIRSSKRGIVKKPSEEWKKDLA